MHFLYLFFLAPTALATPRGRSNPFAPSLARRQLLETTTCLTGEFSCNDGTGGCCPTGTECTFDARDNFPICAGENDACGEEDTYCEETDLCCSAGSTCPTGEGKFCIPGAVSASSVLGGVSSSAVVGGSTVTVTLSPSTTATEVVSAPTSYFYTSKHPSEYAGPSSATAEAVITWTQTHTGRPPAAAASGHCTTPIPSPESLVTDDTPTPTAPTASIYPTLILGPGKSLSETYTPTTVASYPTTSASYPTLSPSPVESLTEAPAELLPSSAGLTTSSVQQFLSLGPSRPYNTTIMSETSRSAYTLSPVVGRTAEVAVAAETIEAVPTGAGARMRAEMGVVVGVVLGLVMVI